MTPILNQTSAQVIYEQLDEASRITIATKICGKEITEDVDKKLFGFEIYTMIKGKKEIIVKCPWVSNNYAEVRDITNDIMTLCDNNYNKN